MKSGPERPADGWETTQGSFFLRAELAALLKMPLNRIRVIPNNCSALVRLNEDGTIGVFTGCVDLTGTNTTMAQIVAEELGVPLEDVAIATGDTDTAPFAPSTLREF